MAGVGWGGVGVGVGVVVGVGLGWGWVCWLVHHEVTLVAHDPTVATPWCGESASPTRPPLRGAAGRVRPNVCNLVVLPVGGVVGPTSNV